MDRQTILTLLTEAEEQFGLAAALDHFYGANVRVKLTVPLRLCQMTIDEMQLSVRSWNALRRAGIDTIGQLIDAAAGDELPRIRNLGRISLSEIKTRLLVMGYQELSPAGRQRFLEYVIDHNTLRCTKDTGML